ncbi:MAG: MMPL family transporter [Thermoplasmata archaeon]|nr:MMPL family transporter [Thermoplasmata archaeon]
MIFDRLADAIIGHAKLIIAIWVVILIACTPLALKAGEVMSYDTNDMADPDSESVKGLAVLDVYFDHSIGDSSSSPIIVIHFDDAAGMQQSREIYKLLEESKGDFRDESGKEKLLMVIAFDPMTGDDGAGILMVVPYYKTNYSSSYVRDDTPNLRGFVADAVAQYAETHDVVVKTYVTGTPAISYDMEKGSMEDISRIDPFTVLLILLLVGLFFRSFVTSATPPLTIGFAFVVVLGLIFLLGQVMNIFFITEMMLLVSMMGAGCDYCIFIIARYREELRAGKEHRDALHCAVTWAGESIATSGASVIIGFGAMSVCSFSLVSTMGICLALGILVALLAALTLIPAILAVVGDRVFWPSKMDSFQEGGKSTRGWYAACGRFGQKYFDHSARFSLKHAKAIAIVTVLVSVPAAYVALTSETSYDMISSMETGESAEGLDYIGEYASAGMLMPDYVVLQYGEPIAMTASVKYSPVPIGMPAIIWSEGWDSKLEGLRSLTAEIVEDPNIDTVDVPYMWEQERQAAIDSGAIDPEKPREAVEYLIYNSPGGDMQYISGAVRQASALLGIYIPREHPEYTREQVERAVYGTILNDMGGFIDYYANVVGNHVGGDFTQGGNSVVFVRISIATVEPSMAPVSMDSISGVEAIVSEYAEDHPDVVAKWVTGTAVVMYEISEVIGGEFTHIEILVVILIIILLFVVMRSYTIPFRSIFTILMSIAWTLTATHFLFVNVLGGEVMWLIPLILLVICLGLGMDYDILLTTRIKENVKAHGMSNDDAIYHAVTHTGSVITVCGLIMGGAFGTLMLSGMVMMQQFGFALCFAILIDALVVRTYIVPAIMHLLGDWNWKGPGSKVARKAE